MTKKNIDNHPAFPFAKTVILGPYVFTSGMVAPKTDDSRSIIEEIIYQTSWLLNAIDSQLNKAGSSTRDVLFFRIFLLDMELSSHVNQVMLQYFNKPLPACTYIQVTALPSPTALIEIESCAVLNE